MKTLKKVTREMVEVEIGLTTSSLKFLTKLSKKTKLSIDILIQNALVNGIIKEALSNEGNYNQHTTTAKSGRKNSTKNRKSRKENTKAVGKKGSKDS